MPWSQFLGNHRAVQQLAELAAGQGPARTILLAGPEGIGKSTLAWMFGLALHCTAPPAPGDFCGQCPSCAAAVKPADWPALVSDALDYRAAEVKTGAKEAAPLQLVPHPALRMYPPDGDFFSLPQARALIHRSQMQPAGGQRWVLIVPEFDRARWATQAALLKTLEEPSPQAWILLLARNRLAVLPTVRSRALQITLGPVPTPELAAALAVWLPQVAPAELELRCRLAQGSPGRALTLELEAYRQTRQEVLEWLAQAVDGEDARLVFRLSESTRSGKEKFETILKILYSVLQDIFYLHTGLSEAVQNVDCIRELKSLQARFSQTRLIQVVEELDHIQSAASRNVFRPLALGSWALGLAAAE